MSTEIALLRALLRISRRSPKQPLTPSLAELVARVGGDVADVQRALASLARSELVVWSGETARLSFAGLAVAVAVTANARRAKTVARPSRPPPMVRRRHAA